MWAVRKFPALKVSSGDTAPTLPAIASAAPVAVAEAAVAEAEEVQRAEIHIGRLARVHGAYKMCKLS